MPSFAFLVLILREFKLLIMNQFTEIVIKWYNEYKRDLPWRDTRDPYIIWISEVILQQTRVAQGYDYFLRFVRRFPTLSELAQAEEDEVLKYWQGLGYYSRARNLHEAAKSMDGIFPKTYQEVRALKGVGDYTAAAICSIAYNMPYAVVDGNVYRVLSRYFGIETAIDSTEGRKLFAALATEMLDTSNPGRYNQAIMDFGALQCVPASPNCLCCPLVAGCLAFRKEQVDKLPVKQHKTKTRNRYFNYIYVNAGSYTYLNKRTEKDIWINLFELPLIETDNAVTETELISLPAFTHLIAGEEVVPIRLLKANVKHVLSHQVIYTNFYEVKIPEDSAAFSSYLKIKREELGDYAVPRLIHAFLEEWK